LPKPVAEAPKLARKKPAIVEVEALAAPVEEPVAVEPPKAVRDIKVPRELPVGAPLAKKEKTLPKPMLSEGAPVVQAPSIGPKTAKRLEAVGVRTIGDLLALDAEEGEQQIDTRHISAQMIRDWQSQALLACTVPGLKSREAQALVACGVSTIEELSRLDAVQLCDAVANWGLSDEGQRAWGSAPAPNEDDVATWIERAKRALQGAASNVAA
jgi:predicted flap endonuclease-1-like 5' DNA nuclease